MAEAPETITFGSHVYEIDGAWLIAERYEDGVELRVYCTSASEVPTTGMFVRRGPRGGLRPAYDGSFTKSQANEMSLRLMDVTRHIRLVEAFREERWPR